MHPSLPSVLPFRPVVAFLVLGALPLAAQSAVVDEGTFTITKNGALIGREAFRIVRAPGVGGQVYRASGTTVLGDRRFLPRLGTDSLGAPVAYDADLWEKGAVVQQLRGSGRPGRFGIASTLKNGSESAREYVLANGALLLDEGVFHHFFFVPLAASHTRAAVIVPRSGVQEQFTLASHGTEPVEIAGTRIPGRRFSVTGPNGGRDVWVDQRGRLLKVSIPEQGLLALRDDPPR